MALTHRKKIFIIACIVTAILALYLLWATLLCCAPPAGPVVMEPPV